MFKKTFVPAFIALSLSAFALILGACGSGSGSGGSKGEEPSSSSHTPMSQVVDPEFIREIEMKNASIANGTLITSVYVEAENILDSVVIMLNGRRVDGAQPPARIYQANNRNSYSFDGNEFCNETFEVCVLAYTDGLADYKGNDCLNIKREEDVCAPSSSSIASSSSAAPMAFEALLSGAELELNSTFGNRGIVLSTGAGSDNINLADIYYNASGSQGDLKTEKSTVKIVTQFQIGNIRAPIYWEAQDDPQRGRVSNPQNTSQFPLSAMVQGSNSEPITGNQYYMIRTGATPNEWTASDYLVLISIDPPEVEYLDPSYHKRTKIKAWRVRN